jgi:hypothetical protein
MACWRFPAVPILAAETDERQAYQILDEEIRRTLGSLLSENLRL